MIWEIRGELGEIIETFGSGCRIGESEELVLKWVNWENFGERVP